MTKIFFYVYVCVYWCCTISRIQDNTFDVKKIGPRTLCCFKEVGSEVFVMGTQETSFIVWFSQYRPVFFEATAIVVTVI